MTQGLAIFVLDTDRPHTRGLMEWMRHCRRVANVSLLAVLLLLFLGIREIVCRCVLGQPKRPQARSLLPRGAGLGLIVCPRLRAFPSSLLLLVVRFFRHCKCGLIIANAI